MDAPFDVSLLGGALLQSASEGIVITADGERILFANEAACELFGYATEEWPRLRVADLVPASIRPAHHTLQQTYLKHAEKKPMGSGRDLTAARKDGSEFPVEISLTPLGLQPDGTQLIAAMITDISPRKTLEQKVVRLNKLLEQKVLDQTRELNRTTAMYRTVARNYPNGTISVLDENLCYEFVEGKELFSLKITSEELFGSAYLDRLPENVRGIIGHRLQQALGGKDQQFEVEHHNQTYRIDALRVTVEGDGKHNLLVVEQNITNVVEALRKERQLHELKSRFISMASHEFRTPLSTIQSSAELAKRHTEMGNPDRVDVHLGKIGQGVTHLVSMLDDYLSLEKFEEGSWQNALEPVNIPEEIRKVVAAHLQLAKSQDAIVCHCTPDHQIEASNPTALRGIAANLISNAVKYSPQGQTVQVRLTLSNDQWLLEVEDQGMGIPEAEQAHVFSRFYRGEAASHISGTGVGLDLVRRYAEELNGQVSFDSQADVGSTFRVIWPAQLDSIPPQNALP